MNSKCISMILAAIAAICVITGETTENVSATKTKGSKQLIFLGNADGKSYFVDNSTKTWKEAQEFCAASSMHLATITSAAQWSLIKSAYNSDTFAGYHWTGLRDAFLPRQFSWDSSGAEPSTTIGIDYGNFDGVEGSYRTCAAFYASTGASTSNKIYIQPCTMLAKVLCET